MSGLILLGAMLLFIALFTTKVIRIIRYLKSDNE